MAQPIWITPAGSVGNFPVQLPMTFQLSATAVLPAISLTYKIISGYLPTGLSMDIHGLISGTPDLNFDNITTQFVVRVTDNLGNLRDRTFQISTVGSSVPQFTTPTGSVLSTQDSVWVELPIQYSNPLPDNDISIRVVQGQLPDGLEINKYGLIRGYANPPIININLGTVVTAITATSETSNTISGISTTGFKVGRPIVFTGTAFGGLVANQTYYIESILNDTSFKITTTPGDQALLLLNGAGNMVATLPNISVGQPTIKTYSFTLKLESLLGNALQSYSITVINQNTPIANGGPGKSPNTRIPTILNTRPATYNLANNIDNYGYYVLPVNSHGETYEPQNNAYIGQFESDNYFAFKVLGYDFDFNPITYVFSNLPDGLMGDSDTGWITGIPVIPINTIEEYSFSVKVLKVGNQVPPIQTTVFNFSLRIANNITGKITWVTPNNLGTIFNGTESQLSLSATSDVSLLYQLVNGILPPNLTLLPNGQIIGTIAYQPTNVYLEADEKTTFTFYVQAISPEFNIVNDTKEFTLTVLQEYTQPTETLYIKCMPSINDRELLSSLLDSPNIFPLDWIYRPEDSNFGLAKNVTYAHAYGIHASDLEEYVLAVTKNHYWRYLTLGEIGTAVARDENGEIIYEVVYSKIIDNLVNLKTPPQSVSKEIYWPRFIDLNLGPWYTSVTNIYTSYETYNNELTFYTSLTPGYARILYPNSLPNMRQQVIDVLGQEYDFRLLPLWMTSQQLNGSTLGYVPAWVICYCKPGYSSAIKRNIEQNWKNQFGDVNRLNQINFQIDRFFVDKTNTYDYDNNLDPATWTGLPSATPEPSPSDSEDFYVLFPRETILPNKTQY